MGFFEAFEDVFICDIVPVRFWDRGKCLFAQNHRPLLDMAGFKPTPSFAWGWLEFEWRHQLGFGAGDRREQGQSGGFSQPQAGQVNVK